MARADLDRYSDSTTRSLYTVDAGGCLSWGHLMVDFLRQSVHINGREIALQPLQVRLLGYFVRHAGRPIAREELREQIFRVVQCHGSTSLARQISVLRNRLGAAGALIVTTPGGYGLGVAAECAAHALALPKCKRRVG